MSNARFLAKGIRATNDKIQFNVDAKVDSDNVRDFGSGGARWKNLYLSGGAYIGGTGSSNYLDDYEEGTFSYTLIGSTGGSWTIRTGYGTGRYTKIGQMVQVQIRFESLGRNSPSGNLYLNGLPFATANHPTSGNGSGQSPCLLRGNTDSGVASHFASYGHQSTYLTFLSQDQGQSGVQAVNAGSHTTGNIEGTIMMSYITE